MIRFLTVLVLILIVFDKKLYANTVAIQNACQRIYFANFKDKARFQIAAFAKQNGLDSDWINNRKIYDKQSQGKILDQNKFKVFGSSASISTFKGESRCSCDISVQPMKHPVSKAMDDAIYIEEIPKSNFPYAEFVGERIRLSQGAHQLEYNLINIGHHQLRNDWDNIQEFIDSHLDENSNQHYRFQMPKNWITGKSLLKALQEKVLFLTTKLYKNKKDYISDEDLYLFRSDRSYVDDDYLVLLDDSAPSPAAIQLNELGQHIVAAIRLVRYSDSNPGFSPSLGFGISNKLPLFEPSNSLSIENDIENLFWGLVRLKNKSIAEISRFARFKNLDPHVMSYFLSRMFDIATDHLNPIDILLIRVDGALRGHFIKEYGFKDLVQLNEPNDKETPVEYLLFLDTHSPEFDLMRTKLHQQSWSVHIAKGASSIANESKWSVYEKIDGFEDGSFFNKSEKTEVEIQKNVKKIKRYRSDHYSYNLSAFSSEQILSYEQAKIILNKINNSDIYSSVLSKFKSLNPVQKQNLNNKIFPNDLFLHAFYEKASGAISIKGHILFVGDKMPFLFQSLNSAYPERSMVSVDGLSSLSNTLNNQLFDDIVVLVPNSFTDVNQLNSLLKRFLAYLKTGGKIHFMFGGTESLNETDLKSVDSYILNELYENKDDLPNLTEEEMAFFLIKIRSVYISRFQISDEIAKSLANNSGLVYLRNLSSNYKSMVTTYTFIKP